ncbi:MAG TPA: hypothetical protein VIA29_01020 [Thermoanaerobaculia bacterium]
MRRVVHLVALALLISAAASAAPEGEFPAGVPETFRVRLGGFFADLETSVSSTPIGDPGLGVAIDFENDLGFEDADTALRADATWRFAKNFAVDFGFVNFSREGSRTATRDFVFGDNVFELGASIGGTFDSTNIYGAFRWDFIKNDTFELGASLGIDYFDLESSVTGSVLVNNVLVSRTTSVAVDAPVPVIGLQATAALGNKFTIGGYVRFLAINIEEAEGSVVDAAARVDWYVWRNVGFGLSYDYNDLDLERLEFEGFEYSFQYKYQGPRVFVILSF